MAISNAIRFVKNAAFDKDLRDYCNETDSKSLIFNELKFNEIEFDDAINMQLVKCASYEEAEVYQQIRLWFSML